MSPWRHSVVRQSWFDGVLGGVFAEQPLILFAWSTSPMAGLNKTSPTPEDITVHSQSRVLEVLFSDGSVSHPV
jgi:hypothetical protein